MAVVPSDIKLFLSGGATNSSPDSSLGGLKSSNEQSNTPLYNLFDVVSSTETTFGDSEYRCVYVENTNVTDTLYNAKVFLAANTPSPDTSVTVGLGTSSISGTEQSIADEDTAPTSVSFSAPTDYDTGLLIGDLAPGASKAVWIRRIVNAGSSAYNNDGYTLAAQGETGA